MFSFIVSDISERPKHKHTRVMQREGLKLVILNFIIFELNGRMCKKRENLNNIKNLLTMINAGLGPYLEVRVKKKRLINICSKFHFSCSTYRN